MAALTEDRVLVQETGDFNEYPIEAGAKIYRGSSVGQNASGYVRPLIQGDRFLGHAVAHADNSDGADGDLSVRVHGPNRYRLKVVVPSLVADQVGNLVGYENDNDLTTSFIGGASIAGRIVRIVDVSSELAIVDFYPCVDPV